MAFLCGVIAEPSIWGRNNVDSKKGITTNGARKEHILRHSTQQKIQKNGMLWEIIARKQQETGVLSGPN
jgi:hypothetical protein